MEAVQVNELPDWLQYQIQASGGPRVYEALVIIENYDVVSIGEFVAAREYLKHLGVWEQIQKEREDLNDDAHRKSIKRPKLPPAKEWSEVEIEWLVNNYATSTTAQLMKKLGRSQAAIRHKATRLRETEYPQLVRRTGAILGTKNNEL